MSCTTQSDNSITTNQIKVTQIRKIYLNNAISNIDNNIFNEQSLKDIIGSDVDKLVLVQNEVPYLKTNLNNLSRLIV